MGYNTDFVGHIDIAPALNDDEIAYLGAFMGSRRFDRPGGPYAVPGNPAAERGDHASYDTDTYNRVAVGQPGLWCDWEVCWDGCCLAYSGNEKFYAPVPWLRYLIDNFLKPGALASHIRDPQFARFTFDHRLDGMTVGCRQDNKELFAIRVTNSRVRTQVLRPADPRYLDFPPLPYEAVNERDRARRSRRQRADATVVDLSTRRARQA